MTQKDKDLLPPETDTPEPSEAEQPARSYKQNPVVTEIPVRCPRCGGARSRVTHTHNFPGRPVCIDGRRYAGSILRRRVCSKCARCFNSRSPLEEDS